MSLLTILGIKKEKESKRNEWTFTDETRIKRDYINSTPYTIPSASTIENYLKDADNGYALVGHDFFYRVDGIIRRNELRLRDYGFRNIIFCRSGERYILEGDGLFMKKDYYGEAQKLSDIDCAIHAELMYDAEKRLMTLHNCRGFRESDRWYTFPFIFKLIEHLEKEKSLQENENIAENADVFEKQIAESAGNEKSSETANEESSETANEESSETVNEESKPEEKRVRDGDVIEYENTIVIKTNDEKTISEIRAIFAEKDVAAREREQKEDEKEVADNAEMRKKYPVTRLLIKEKPSKKE